MSALALTTAEAWSALAGVTAIGAALARGEECDERHAEGIRLNPRS